MLSDSALKGRKRLGRIPLPTPVDILFSVLLLVNFARPAGLEGLLADGDIGWHIRTGELTLARRDVPVQDPFSFSRPGEPWVAWEWGSDVLFSALWRWRGLAAVAALCGAVIAASAASLFAFLLGSGTGLAIALAASLAAVSASSIHYLARPHVFSILLYGIALWGLQRDRACPGRRVWLLIPLIALWSNLHAGFVAGLGTIALLAAGCAARREWPRARRYSLLAAGSAAASLANPYGWKLHAHVLSYLASPWVMNYVREFQSPSIRSESAIVYALLLLAAVAASARVDWYDRSLVMLWAFASLRSARHAPFFALAAAPVLARTVAAYCLSAAERLGPRSTLAILRDFGGDFSRASRVSVWALAPVVFVFATLPCIDFPRSRFPITAVDRNLARFSAGEKPPRILTSDQWADYMIYRLYPRQRVFFDGRSDFFGDRIGGEYRKLLAAEEGWRALLNRHRFGLALLPRDWPLSTMLDSEPGWRRVYEDDLGVLYERRGAI